MHQLPPHLIFTYRTLPFISIEENDAFSRRRQISKHAILQGPYFNQKFVSAERIYCTKVVERIFT